MLARLKSCLPDFFILRGPFDFAQGRLLKAPPSTVVQTFEAGAAQCQNQKQWTELSVPTRRVAMRARSLAPPEERLRSG
jgi:hypothetical protein